MIFEQTLKLMENISSESLNKSIADCHIEGLFSLVVGGTENGELTRIFYATKKIKPFQAQLHSHCYDLNIGVVHGNVKHHIAEHTSKVSHYHSLVWLKEYKYCSPLNGGNGLTYLQETPVDLFDVDLPVGGEICLSYDEIHTVSCSKGSIWIVREKGFKTKESVVLGVPFITEGLYNAPKQYQINDVYQLVLDKLRKVVGET
jgi:hypothetical protein